MLDSMYVGRANTLITILPLGAHYAARHLDIYLRHGKAAGPIDFITYQGRRSEGCGPRHNSVCTHSPTPRQSDMCESGPDGSR